MATATEHTMGLLWVVSIIITTTLSPTSVRIQLQGCCSEGEIYNSTSVHWPCPWSHVNTSPMMNPIICTSHLMTLILWSHLKSTNQNLEHIKHNSDCYMLGISLPLTEWVCPFSVHEIEGGSVERLNTDKLPSCDEQANLVLSSLENRIAVTRDQRIFDTSDWSYLRAIPACLCWSKMCSILLNS